MARLDRDHRNGSALVVAGLGAANWTQVCRLRCIGLVCFGFGLACCGCFVMLGLESLCAANAGIKNRQQLS